MRVLVVFGDISIRVVRYLRTYSTVHSTVPSELTVGIWITISHKVV